MKISNIVFLNIAKYTHRILYISSKYYKSRDNLM